MKDQIKQILKESLRVSTKTERDYVEVRDGCGGFYALVTTTTVTFDGEVISEIQTEESL